MPNVLYSLAEVSDLERAYALGAPTLGRAAVALLERWRWPLRDEEKFIRLAFLCWYQQNEPEWLTGLEASLPTVDVLIAERGGERSLTLEAGFVSRTCGRSGRRWKATPSTTESPRSRGVSGRLTRSAAASCSTSGVTSLQRLVTSAHRALTSSRSCMHASPAVGPSALPGILGCPHEEGTDYPLGGDCPQCPYWAGRERPV